MLEARLLGRMMGDFTNLNSTAFDDDKSICTINPCTEHSYVTERICLEKQEGCNSANTSKFWCLVNRF
jgi:hypothetical protein